MAAVIAAGVVLAPETAHAQACCAGGTVLTPGRLNLHEQGLVGLQLRGAGVIGSYDGTGAFVAPGKGASEGDFEEDLIASLRVFSRGQVTLLVPIVETYRRASGLAGPVSVFGGGFGDVQVNGRWDATLAGASRIVPGVAILASMILPTGRPPDEGDAGTLGVGSTGTGALQGALGLSLEQTYGKVLVNLTGSGTVYSARSPMGTHTQLGPSFGGFAALGYSFEPGPVMAATLSYSASLDTKLAGVLTPDTARRQLVVGLAGGYIVNDSWRIQGGVFLDPPASHAGQNEPATAGATATLFRTW